MKNNFKAVATQTMIASAIAAMMAGAAFAAETDAINNVTIGENGALVITGNSGTASAAASTGNVTTGQNEGTIGKGPFNTTDGISLTMNGGSLTVKANNETQGAHNGEFFLKDLTLSPDFTNTITVDATGLNSTIISKSAFNTSAGNVVLAFSGAGDDQTTTTAKLRTEDSEDVTLGGNHAVTAISVAEGTTARIQAGTDANRNGAVSLSNITLNNAGTLTFRGASIALTSDYVNAGAGQTIFDATDGTTISGDFTTTKFGMVGSADDADGYKEVALQNVEVNGGAFTAESIDVLANTFTLSGAEASVTAKTITVGGKDVTAAAYSATKGNTTADFTISTGGTVTFSDSANLRANTITVTKSDAQNATGGSLSLGGTYDIGTVDVQTATTATASGEGTIGTLKVGNSQTFTNRGKLTLGTLSLAAESDEDAADNGKFEMLDGSLTTAGANLLNYDPEATTNKLTKVEGVTISGGEVVLTDENYQYSVADYNTVKAALGSPTTLVLKNGTLVAKDADGNVTGNEEFSSAVTLGYAGRSAVDWTYNRSDATATLSNDATMGTINFVRGDSIADDEKLESVTITGDGHKLTLRGNGANGELFTGDEAADASFKLDGVDFGEAGMGDSGVVSQDVTLVSSSEVNGTFTFNGELKIGEGTTDPDEVTLKAAKDAVVFINNLAPNVEADPDAQPAVAAYTQGKLEAAGGTIAVKGAKEGVFTLSAGAIIAADADNQVGGLLVAGDYYEAAKAYQDAHSLDNTLWIGQATQLDQDVTFRAKATGEWNGVQAGGENTIAIDLASLSASGYKAGATLDTTKAVITGEGTISDTTRAVGQIDKLYLANLQGISHDVLVYNEAAGKYQLNVGKDLTAGRVDFGTPFYNEDALAGGVLTFDVDEHELGDLQDWGFHSYQAVKDSLYNVQFNNGIANAIIFGMDKMADDFDRGFYEVAKASGLLNADVTFNDFTNWAVDPQHSYSFEDKTWIDHFVNEEDIEAYYALMSSYESKFIGAIVEAEHTQTNMAVYGGAFSTAIDINNEVWKALDRRTSLANLNVARNATGITPWVDVLGTWNAADSLYGSSGYEADIYGAVIGADWTASCGAILGIAFNVGQADANSKDSATKVENDVDFWGVSLYGSHQIGHVNGKFDLGYISTSNDLSAHSAYFGRTSESLDADIFTIGLGAEYLTNVGALNVVPHAGIRWTRLDMDDSKYGADYDAMNLFQMPLGVTFSGTFDMTGWKLAPMFDISVIPTFGDKDAVANYAGGIDETIRVVDSNPVQATLGVNASVDAWTFGVNYGLSAGSDDRLNNSFNLNARYTF